MNLKKISLSNPKTWLVFLASVYTATFFFSAIIRIGFPYQLTWMEGAVVDHMRCLLEGKTLYGPPSMEFTPFIYAPFYYYFCAFLMKIFGVGFFIPRLVSLISSILLLVLVWRLIKHETQSFFYAWIGVGLTTAFYSLTGGYFDMARVDSLFNCLLLGGLYFLRMSRDNRGIYLSALFFFLALFTKQQALPVILVLAVYLFIENKRKGLHFVSIISFLSIITFILFEWSSEGWFSFYVYRLPQAHGFLRELAFLIIQDLFASVPVLLIFLSYIFFKSTGDENIQGKSWFKSRYIIYLVFFIGALATSWASRAHDGGTENVLLPVLLSIVLLGTMAFWQMESDIKTFRYIGVGFLFFLMALQFILLAYNPRIYWPKEGHYRSNEMLMRLIQGYKGPVLIPSVGYLPTRVGKETHAHKTAIYDILRADSKQMAAIKFELHRQYRTAISKKKFDAIIIRRDGFYLSKIKPYYKLKRRFLVFPSIYVHGYKSDILDLEVYVPN